MRSLGIYLASGSLLFCGSVASAIINPQVDAGYDLFQSITGTSFQGIPFTGVPIGNYNFGGTIGVQDTDLTDTIVQRLANATPTSPTIPLQMNALQLVSDTPVAFGGGPLGFYYIDLQSTDGTGPASTGSMTIGFGTPTSGTFTSSLDVFFDVHYAALNGPIVYASDLVLSNPGATWSDMAPPGAVLINGVNNMLNGNDITNDFWPGVLQEAHPSGVGIHVVQAAQMPEPASLALIASAGLFAARRPRRR